MGCTTRGPHSPAYVVSHFVTEFNRADPYNGPVIATAELLRLFASPARVAEIAPDLGLNAGISAGDPAASAAATDDQERGWLVREGLGCLRGAADPGTADALVRGIEALHARGLAAPFVYAFDDAWALGEHLRARISRLVGREYRLVEDVWAWRIEPGTGRGWPAHRGIADVRLDRDAPEAINVWVALTDVTADRACMHAVPLEDDPGYPEALDRVDAPLTSVRALPVRAGDALFWNANVLHWGGRCAARAAGPRVSCSFTLCRNDAATRFPDMTLLPPLASFDLAARMDVLARMVLLYGTEERGEVSGVVREWASLTHALATRFGRLA